MNLLDEIRECFATKVKGARQIKSLPELYPCWTIRIEDSYGVAVPYHLEQDISEKFANSKISSCNMKIGGEEKRLLVLSCANDNLRVQFAVLCAHFADPGEKGIERINLVNDPTTWWSQWQHLIGNAISSKEPYSVIGELLVLENLIQSKYDVTWTGPEAGSHDIEAIDESFEVKSSTNKYGADVTISSQHQLRNNKPLFLYFCRLEASRLGISINEMVKRLISLGYDKELLEKQLDRLGYELGSSSRNKKYKVLEKRKYNVDDNFPKITNESFKNEKVPDCILHIKYSVDLDGLDYTVW